MSYSISEREEHRSFSRNNQSFDQEEHTFTAENRSYMHENPALDRIRRGRDFDRNPRQRFVEEAYHHMDDEMFRRPAGPDFHVYYQAAGHLPWMEIVPPVGTLNEGYSQGPARLAGLYLYEPGRGCSSVEGQVGRDLAVLDRTVRDAGSAISAFEQVRDWIRRTDTHANRNT